MRLLSKKAADGSDISSVKRYNAVFSNIREDLSFLLFTYSECFTVKEAVGWVILYIEKKSDSV